MRLMKKQVVILFILFLFMHNTIVYAQTPIAYNSLITPRWMNISGVDLMINFRSNQAICSSMIFPVSGTTSVNASYILECKTPTGWSYVNSWSKVETLPSDGSLGYLSYFIFEASSSVSYGSIYRLKVSIAVVANGQSESGVMLYSSERTAIW